MLAALSLLSPFERAAHAQTIPEGSPASAEVAPSEEAEDTSAPAPSSVPASPPAAPAPPPSVAPSLPPPSAPVEKAPEPSALEPSPAPPSLPLARTQPPPRLPLERLDKPISVSVERDVLYEIRTSSKEHPAADRARSAVKALELAAAHELPESVRVRRDGELAIVYAGKLPLIQLFPEDAEAHGHSSLEFHADSVAMRFREHLEAEARRRAIASTVFSVSLVVLLSLVALALLRRTGELGDRAHLWLEHNRHKVPSLQVQSLELVGPAAMRSGALLGVEVGKWLLRLLIVYLWALVSLSQFERSRGFMNEITQTFLGPLPEILRRAAGMLPLLGVILLGAGIVIALMRFVQLFFAGVARRETELPWLRAELAEPVSVLIRSAIVLLALLIGAPIITGSTDSILSRAGIVLLLSLGLAAAPALGSFLVGIGTVFGHKLETSDLVVFGGRQGRVVSVGLFHVVLRDALGAEIRVPQLLSLFRPTEFLERGSRVRIELSLEKLSERGLDALRRAAASVGTEEDVGVLGVDKNGALVSVSVKASGSAAHTRLFLAALRELEAEGLALGSTPASQERAAP